MTGLMRQWILGVTCAAMIGALMQVFLPKNGIGKAGRLAAGLLLVLAAVGPLAEIDYDGLAQSVADLRAEGTGYARELEEKNDEILRAVIERETEAYISDKAGELGIDCRAEVVFAAGEDGTLRPDRVRIFGELTGGDQVWLSELLESELGVPAGRQSYTKEEAG